MDFTLTVTTIITGGTFIAVVIFFIIVCRQEIQEFKDNPLLQLKNRNRTPPLAPPPTRVTSRNNSCESDQRNKIASTLTLEMSNAGGDEFGSREQIIRNGQVGGASQRRKDMIGYDNPSMDPYPSSQVCQV